MAAFDIDVVLDNLMSVGIGKATIMDRMPEATIQILLKTVRQQFLNQPMLLEINSPVTLCGDIHGQYNDLLRLFNTGGWPNQTNYMFLGDYVDRGKQNVETILLLFALRVNFYGFFDECIRKYSTVVYYMFQDVFNTMPVAGLVGDRILCMHGGLSPHLKSLDDIRNVKRPIDPSDNPRNDLDNARGVSVVFGENEVRRACNLLDIDLVARAHQVVQDGYEFFADRQLVTIFSAPHYCGDYDNAAAIMKVDENLMCSFEVLKPTMSKSLRLG